MNSFNRRTAFRIAAASILLATLSSPVAWYVARKQAEASTVLLAIEESRRLLRHFDAISLAGPDAKTHAVEAAATIIGGLFDIAEIYDRQGEKIAEAMTPAGTEVEEHLPRHGRPDYATASHTGLRLQDERHVLRVFVPLHDVANTGESEITGYFEGVRIIPDWQRSQMLADALSAALLAGLASLLCGVAIYPIVVRLSADNEQKARELLDSHISMMEALGRAIAKRDSETGAHNYRVAWIAARIGESMRLGDDAMQSLIAGSFLHDVGKIGIPDAILLKPGKLDEEETTIMHTHVRQGEEIVTGMGWLDGANAVVAGHHEKWDGTGYPRGLHGDQIPLAARIFAVADVFDALCSKRPYKEPMDFAAVMAILARGTGSHFDPAVIDVFRPVARELFDSLNRYSEENMRRLLGSRIHLHFGV